MWSVIGRLLDVPVLANYSRHLIGGQVPGSAGDATNVVIVAVFVPDGQGFHMDGGLADYEAAFLGDAVCDVFRKLSAQNGDEYVLILEGYIDP
jgi:hypothetical protein